MEYFLTRLRILEIFHYDTVTINGVVDLTFKKKICNEMKVVKFKFVDAN